MNIAILHHDLEPSEEKIKELIEKKGFKAFLFDVSKLTKKSYNLDVYIYIDTDELMDSEVVSFNVEECQSDLPEEIEEEEEETTESTVIVTTLDPEEASGTGSETQQVSSSTIVATTENSYTTEDFLIGAVIIAIILIVALIIVFFVVLLK